MYDTSKNNSLAYVAQAVHWVKSFSIGSGKLPSTSCLLLLNLKSSLHVIGNLNDQIVIFQVLWSVISVDVNEKPIKLAH